MVAVRLYNDKRVRTMVPTNLLSFIFKCILICIFSIECCAAQTLRPIISPYNSMQVHKNIAFMPITLTSSDIEKFTPAKINHVSLLKNTGLPSTAVVDMSDTPVLDQGPYSTCVTFAVTTAIDSLLHKGDYVSQLCNLTLAVYLTERGFFPNAWNGTTAQYVLNQIVGFGIINKTNQQSKSCAGLAFYPVYGDYYSVFAMTPEEFAMQSENMSDKIAGFPLLTYSQRIHWNDINKDGDRLKMKIKRLINANSHGKPNLVTMAFLLPHNNCNVSACATYHQPNDTWSLVNTGQQLTSTAAAHELIIFGYDDNAVVTDNVGGKHTGIFLLRNSWGNNTGDHGVFYMTYDFFESYVIEAEDIYLVPA